MTEKKQLTLSLFLLLALAFIFIGPKNSEVDHSLNDLRNCKHNKGRIECAQKAPLKDKVSTSAYYLR